MAKGKKPTERKAAAGKAASKAKPRKPPVKKSAAEPRKGHNNPPPEYVPPPSKAQPVMLPGWLMEWASYGHQLIATAQSIGEWVANLPL